jgi:hypothetical protein
MTEEEWFGILADAKICTLMLERSLHGIEITGGSDRATNDPRISETQRGEEPRGVQRKYARRRGSLSSASLSMRAAFAVFPTDQGGEDAHLR